MRALIVVAVFLPAVLPNALAAEAAGQLPSEKQVLTFIGDTIDWYRQLPTSQRIGSEPADVFFLENNRSTATEVVRLSFRFGKAMAAIQAQTTPGHPESRHGTPADRELPYLMSVQTRLGASTQRSGEQLNSLTRARLTARAADLKKLDSQIGEARLRIQLLNTISANFQNLADFIRTASADSTPDADLAALVEDLERTVPEVSAGDAAPKTANTPGNPPRAPYGIMGRISRISALSRKEQYVESAIDRTNALIKALQNLRNPFRQAFLQQVATFSSDEENLDVLQQQQLLLTDVVAQLQTVSPAVAALIKQETLLNLYRSHLEEWHAGIRIEYRAAWQAMIIRLCVLAVSLAVLAGIGVVVRRVTSKHVKDRETRQALLVGERVLLWILGIAIVLVAFAFDPSSLATFLGVRNSRIGGGSARYPPGNRRAPVAGAPVSYAGGRARRDCGCKRGTNQPRTHTACAERD